ncbi:MAG: hypothetical protein COV75_06905 [Candidatus Omnitrophica bacterium CG11_big_fil_rev_8_21_14_0_20_63_9]|nr:MAG: hypothetical protein COV75_06905 [Candidatus Omnitrophica bacterium CG11_big_fil_rev_8_21_14_0_20_63_9]
MRILDRYVAKQLLPVWVWCLAVFVFLSCLIDLFEHLDEIMRYHIPALTVARYYLHFMPIVFVRASPLALLLAGAFVASRLSRHQEFLAMNASGTSLLRASVPFVFVGWLASLCVFLVSDIVLPRSAGIYEQLRQEAFRADQEPVMENVAVIDSFNRIYHAQKFDLEARELWGVTILEHDRQNRPTSSISAERALWIPLHGWWLRNGRINRLGAKGAMRGDPQPFTERVFTYPVTPEQFSRPQTRPEMMRYGQLRLMITRLKQMGMDVRRYSVELAAKVTTPLMNVVVCFLAFAGSTQLQLRGNLKGLGLSLGWGLLYYGGVATGQAMGKEGILWMPVLIAVWAPHAIAVWWGLRVLGQTR